MNSGWGTEFTAARRHDLIALIGGRERAYFAYQRLLRRPARTTLVTPDTDLCIEAPPGSGNTFFVAGFAQANPDVQVAHHHHVAAQVRRAQRYRVPTLLIAREPSACVLSRAVSWRHPAAIGPAYREWISFWGNVVRLVDHGVVVSFDDVTGTPAAVVEMMNERYGTTFSCSFPPGDQVFATMDRARAVAFPTFSTASEINPNRPDDRKAELKARLGPLVQSHRLAGTARRLFDSVARMVAAVHA